MWKVFYRYIIEMVKVLRGMECVRSSTKLLLLTVVSLFVFAEFAPGRCEVSSVCGTAISLLLRECGTSGT